MPTAIDPTLTDDGSTVLTMFTQYGPHAEEGWPDGAREAYAQRCFELLGRYAPNVPDAVEHYEVLAPPDLERIFGLVGGSIFQGEQGLDQMAFMRPSPSSRSTRRRWTACTCAGPARTRVAASSRRAATTRPNACCATAAPGACAGA